jgi:hypothetical protein
MGTFSLRPSPATVIACIALFVALGGTAVAAEQPAVNAPSAGLTYHLLTLQNGWVGKPFGTRAPAVAKDSQGTIHLEGAMATSGSNLTAFTLPAGYRPSAPVYVTVDLANAQSGRLAIATNGVVTVEAETNVADAKVFTSLEGVVFAP